MIRRTQPLKRTPLKRGTKPIRKRRKEKKSSMKYEVVDGKFRRYPDGREVCLDTPKGWLEYRSRTDAMVYRQHWACGIKPCKLQFKGMTLSMAGAERATFQHGDGRGMGGARRNDNIDAPGNVAAHWACNSQLGSRRVL